MVLALAIDYTLLMIIRFATSGPTGREPRRRLCDDGVVRPSPWRSPPRRSRFLWAVLVLFPMHFESFRLRLVATVTSPRCRNPGYTRRAGSAHDRLYSLDVRRLGPPHARPLRPQPVPSSEVRAARERVYAKASPSFARLGASFCCAPARRSGRARGIPQTIACCRARPPLIRSAPSFGATSSTTPTPLYDRPSVPTRRRQCIDSTYTPTCPRRTRTVSNGSARQDIRRGNRIVHAVGAARTIPGSAFLPSTARSSCLRPLGSSSRPPPRGTLSGRHRTST